MRGQYFATSSLAVYNRQNVGASSHFDVRMDWSQYISRSWRARHRQCIFIFHHIFAPLKETAMHFHYLLDFPPPQTRYKR